LPEGTMERVLKGHTASVRHVTFTPDGARLATLGNDRTARLWDPATGAELCALRSSYQFVEFGCVAFSPDGTRLAFPTADGTLQIADGRPWNLEIQNENEAQNLVDGLFNWPLLKDAVLEQIRGNKTRSEAVRRLALELAARYPDEPNRFERASRNV